MLAQYTFLGVSIVLRQNLFLHFGLTPHAPRAWWLEPAKYAPIALERASTALADSRGQTQKLPCISLSGSSPHPSAERRKKERKFLVCVAKFILLKYITLL